MKIESKTRKMILKPNFRFRKLSSRKLPLLALSLTSTKRLET
jgi:hypothetical protein